MGLGIPVGNLPKGYPVGDWGTDTLSLDQERYGTRKRAKEKPLL